MHSLLFYFAVAGALSRQPAALPVAPFDIEIGHQVVEVRDAMMARSPGVRMVLFVRGETPARFETRYPTGSVTAHLRDTRGQQLTLVHTGYTYYRGHAGLKLTEQAPAARGQAIAHFEHEAKVSLHNVRVVWLDRLARRVEDLQPAL
jgi:hypothetical protein